MSDLTVDLLGWADEFRGTEIGDKLADLVRAEGGGALLDALRENQGPSLLALAVTRPDLLPSGA